MRKFGSPAVDEKFKWKVMRAVRLSTGLTRDQRVVLMMLADCAEDNGKTKPRWAPSLGQLATWTGLGRSTVAEVLNQLDVEAKKPDEPPGLGWVRRFQPTVEAARMLRHKTLYQVLIGTDPEPAPKQKRPRRPAEDAPPTSPGAGLVQGVDYSPSPGRGLVQEPDYHEGDIADFEEWSRSRTSPGAGLEVVQEPDPPSPGAGLDLVREPDTTPAPPAGAPASPAKNTPLANARSVDDEPPAVDEGFELAEPPAEKKPKRAAKPDTGETPEFVEFYDAFPRKSKRPDALKAWRAALKKVNPDTKRRVTPAEIMVGVAAFAAYHAQRGTDQDYIKTPGPWLRAEMWRDDYPLSARHQSGPFQNPGDSSAYHHGDF